MYKPMSVASSVVGGLIAGKIFTEIWQRINPDDEEPDPKDLSRSTREVMIAAAVQGLIVGVVRAVMARGQAKGFQALTNEDPS
ncbi:membrane protein [Mycolicibacterium celeriflavum]|uniref:Membrane protein n=2 Tax=Mycolicibacterium celeriflavum TaxID=1249101 RepID=A0A7I7RPW4_MYCCF|nr:membrane protein [Mycolicibacterium celeriflavum]